MPFFKKFSKLDDVVFHLVNHLNKKKLKLNILLTKNWEYIVSSDFIKKSNLKNITYDKKSDSCSIEIICDPSIVLELRSRLSQIKLRIEQTIGIKVKKLNFFQDIFSSQSENRSHDDKNYHDPSKKVNKIEFNGIKEAEASLIFERINKIIKNENK